jgi:hypothetical protein
VEELYNNSGDVVGVLKRYEAEGIVFGSLLEMNEKCRLLRNKFSDLKLRFVDRSYESTCQLYFGGAFFFC